ncbi:MAG: hypothetical protein ACR2K3_04535 [Nocardioides sp.]
MLRCSGHSSTGGGSPVALDGSAAWDEDVHEPTVRRLLAVQSGVVSRAQVLAAGGTDADLARLVRRRELVRLHEGVFVDHTGQPTWQQRAWAAVLCCWRPQRSMPAPPSTPTSCGATTCRTPPSTWWCPKRGGFDRPPECGSAG